MTRIEIKLEMLKHINDALEAEFKESKILEAIDKDTIYDYLWTKDFGMQLIEEYIEEYKNEIIEAYLDEIFDEIETSDLTHP